MSDGNEVSGQQAAQPETASKGAQPGGSTLSPDVIQQVVKQTVEQTVESALSAYEKRQQSQRDKQEARINKRLTDYENTYKTLLGQDLTPEQRSQLRSRATEEVKNEIREDVPEPSQQAAAQPPAKAEEPSAMEKLILKKFEKAGMTIEDGDPELALLANIDPTDLDDLKEKIDNAIEQKRARLQTKPSNLNPDAASRVSAATATGLPNNLETQYRAELEQMRRGDANAFMKIKDKYRKLGLKV